MSYSSFTTTRKRFSDSFHSAFGLCECFVTLKGKSKSFAQLTRSAIVSRHAVDRDQRHRSVMKNVLRAHFNACHWWERKLAPGRRRTCARGMTIDDDASDEEREATTLFTVEVEESGKGHWLATTSSDLLEAGNGIL